MFCIFNFLQSTHTHTLQSINKNKFSYLYLRNIWKFFRELYRDITYEALAFLHTKVSSGRSTLRRAFSHSSKETDSFIPFLHARWRQVNTRIKAKIEFLESLDWKYCWSTKIYIQKLYFIYLRFRYFRL